MIDHHGTCDLESASRFPSSAELDVRLAARNSFPLSLRPRSEVCRPLISCGAEAVKRAGELRFRALRLSQRTYVLTYVHTGCMHAATTQPTT